MNIKSLLLGSAAALVAVSGARAADAVVMVEPEPMEYVRVCDVYGTGFFYIPGTETCLKIGGYVRMRIEAADGFTNNDVDFGNLNSTIPVGTTFGRSDVRGTDNEDYRARTRVRARLDFDAREETELGQLRGFVRVEATNTSNDSAAYAAENAFLQLGGLTMGYKDSLFAERDGLFVDNDFSVGDITQNVASYTFAVAGFTAAISAEDDGSGDFVPDVVGQLAYEGGFGEAYISGVYDEQTGSTVSPLTNGLFTAIPSDFTTGGLLFDDPRTAAVVFSNQGFFNGDLNDDDGSFALKGGVTLKDLLATGSQFKIEGSYAFDPTRYTSIANMTGNTIGVRQDTFLVGGQTVVRDLGGNTAFGLSSEYQIGAAYQQSFNKLTARVAGYFGETFDLKFAEVSPVVGAGVRTVNIGSAEYFGGGVNVEYALTSNFSIMGEVTYFDIDLPSTLSDADRTSGFLEFKRSF